MGGERKRGNNYSASFIRTERNNGGQPRKTWSYSDLQMERRNDSPRPVIAGGKKRTSEAKQSKNRVGEKDKKRRMGGREGKNIHKNPVVYEEEETVQRFRSEIIEASKTSRIFLFIFSSGVCAS
ncbi:hypothetical protein CEXT_394181 [Caerostris extrusa]|uniref:Uncharacterized protein n=1 Tax=Caerostris extrusa TaxID=172846 RepID=A0AAV4QAQ7_CAEEX|nr:hypothetical protein CEXT_394181 [Caerostris extrusa]